VVRPKRVGLSVIAVVALLVVIVLWIFPKERVVGGLQRIGEAWKIAEITLPSADGGQVELGRGQNLVVSLKGRMTTGYT
jgi:hypothetical protein